MLLDNHRQVVTALMFLAVTLAACQPAQSDIVMPTLMVLPSVTHTEAPTLTPLVNLTEADSTPTTAPTETPTSAAQLARSIDVTETASETAIFTPTFTPSPTRTSTSTHTTTRTSTSTATRTATATASVTASKTVTRTPIPTLPLPATVTPTVIITRIVQPPHAGEDPQIGGVSSTMQPGPTLPIPIPPASIIPTSTPSMMPTIPATSTPSSGQPPTLAVTSMVAVTPVSGAPGESQPPPGAGSGLPTALPPAVINPPNPVNPSPTMSEGISPPPGA